MVSMSSYQTLHIGKASSFTPIPDSDEIQHEYYEFATRRGLEIQSQKSWGIVDYIGICQRLKDGTTKDNKPYIIMFLRDHSNRDITVALWSNIITSPSRFNRAQIEGAPKPVIIGLTAMKAHNYEGNQHKFCCEPKKGLMQYYFIRSHTINGHVSDLQTYKDWFYPACPTCNQLVYPKPTCWYCTRDGSLEKPTHMYKLSGTITDATGDINATFFDKATTQLLNKSCEHVLAKDPTQLLHEIIGKDAQFNIQIQKDKKLDTICCIVNSACLLGEQSEEATSTSTMPLTPTSKLGPVKRSLTLTLDENITMVKEKLPRTSSDD